MRKTKSEYEYKSHKYVYFLLVHRKTVEKKLMKKIKMIEKKKEEKQIKKKWIDYKVYKRRNSLKSCHDLEVIDNMHVIVVITEKNRDLTKTSNEFRANFLLTIVLLIIWLVAF